MIRIMVMLTFVVAHLAVLLLLAVVSYVLGRRITCAFHYASVWEEGVCSTTLGLGVIGALIFLLGLLGLLHTWASLVALVALQPLCFPIWRDLVKRLTITIKRMCGRPAILAGALLALAVLTPIWLLPLYPPTAFDATMYHLPYAKLYVQHHQALLTPYLRFPVSPQLNEMLFTLMLLFYDDIAAQLVQFLMMGLVAIALYAWGCRHFSSQVGLWAAALWLANPLVLWLGASAYIDIGLTLFITMAVYAFWNWLHAHEKRWLILAGVFGGFAAGSKYPALFFLGLLGLVTLYISIRKRKYSAPFVFTAIAFAVAAPWYLRNLYYTGNPVFPFFPEIFGYSLWNAEDLQGQLYDLRYAHGLERSFWAFISLPWHLAFNQESFVMEAPLSPLYFFALPLLMVFGATSVPIRGILALVLAYTLFWFFSAQILRYLVPALPLLSLATAAALERFLPWLPPIRRWASRFTVAAIAAVLLVSPGWLYAAYKVKQQGPIPVIQEQRDAYLSQHLPSYSAYKFLNELKGRDYTLYALYDTNMAYFADGTFMGDWFGPARYSRILSSMESGQDLYEALKSLGAQYFLVSKHRWQVELPDDGFFRNHFKLIYARAYVMLFEVVRP